MDQISTKELLLLLLLDPLCYSTYGYPGFGNLDIAYIHEAAAPAATIGPHMLLYLWIFRIWEPGLNRYPRSSCYCCYYSPPLCNFIYGYPECGNLDGSDIHEAAAPAPTIGPLMLLYLWISRIWEPGYSIHISTKQLLLLLLLAPICFFIYGYPGFLNLDGADIHEAAAPAATIGPHM